MSEIATLTPQSRIKAMLGLDLITIGGWRYVAGFAIAILAGSALFSFLGLQLLGIALVIQGMNLIAAPATYRLNTLTDSLPISRRQVITSHYVAILLATVGYSIAVIAGALLRSLLNIGSQRIDLSMVTVALSGSLAILSILMPVILKWGQRLGVLVIFIGTLVGFGALWAWTYLDLPLPSLTFAALTAGELLLALGIYALSWSICVRIYEHQDH